jgi:tetratricopeptide (TPR) repeat protein
LNGGTLWSRGSVRRLLRGLRRPAQLERDELALELKRVQRTASGRDAVLLLIERALRHEHRFCGEIVRRCDVEGETTLVVATALHLSPRQFFRYRAHAIEAVAVEMDAVLTRAPSRSASEDALRAVALGKLLLSRWSPSDVASAMRHFERAAAIDPLCVEAYSGLAIAWLNLSRDMMTTPQHAHAKARSLAKRALVLEPRSAVAHSTFARVAIDAGLGRAAAAPHVIEALSLDPFDARAHIANFNLALVDADYAAAERSAVEAVKLDSTSFTYAICAMAATFFRRAWNDAIEQARELLTIEPRSHIVRIYLADALIANGAPEEALGLLQPGERLGEDPYELASIARARADVGDRSGAQRTLEHMLTVSGRRQVSPYLIAYARVASGDMAGALDDLEAAVREDPGWLNLLEQDPAFFGLYDERRFRRLIALRPKGIR